MIRPFKDWEIHKVVTVIAALVALVATAYVNLPFHVTFVLILCLLLVLFFIFYPWRFPKWREQGRVRSGDDFYPVMRCLWIGVVTLAVLVGLSWPTVNFVWQKSPEILTERLQEAHIDLEQDLKMSREGVWDAKLDQPTPAAPPILVALPALDQNRLPRSSNDRRCVPFVQAVRVAFGELSSYSRDLRLTMIMAIFFGCGLAGIERLHEARRNADARRITTTGMKSNNKC